MGQNALLVDISFDIEVLNKSLAVRYLEDNCFIPCICIWELKKLDSKQKDVEIIFVVFLV